MLCSVDGDMTFLEWATFLMTAWVESGGPASVLVVVCNGIETLTIGDGVTEPCCSLDAPFCGLLLGTGLFRGGAKIKREI